MECVAQLTTTIGIMKFAVLFGLLALAYVAQAHEYHDIQKRSIILDHVKDQIKSVRENFDKLVEGAREVVKATLDEAKKDFLQIMEKLKEVSDGVKKQAQRSLEGIFETVDNQVAELQKYAESKGLDEDDTKGCLKMKHTFRESGLLLLANVESCVIEKVDNAQDNAMKIVDLAKVLISEVSEIKKEADACMPKEGASLLSLYQSLACLTTAGAKVAIVTTKKIPAVVWGVTKIYANIASIQPTLIYCVPKNTLEVLIETGGDVVSSVNGCIAEKIQQFLSGRGKGQLEGPSDNSTGIASSEGNNNPTGNNSNAGFIEIPEFETEKPLVKSKDSRESNSKLLALEELSAEQIVGFVQQEVKTTVAPALKPKPQTAAPTPEPKPQTEAPTPEPETSKSFWSKLKFWG